MAHEMISNNESLYLSAPTTPTPFTLDHLNFYSAPTSPIPTSKTFTYDYDDDYQDANNSFIEFEFETSRLFIPEDDDFDQMGQSFDSPYDQQQEHHQHKDKESLPAMALLMSCSVMAKSPTVALKFPFPRRSLWNDDFDPFAVALENVKDDNNIEKRNKEKDYRPARSVSPVRALNPKRPNKSMSFHHQDINRSGHDQNGQMEPEGPYSIWFPYRNRKMEPIRLAEPKGVLFARHTRLVKMGHEKAKRQKETGKNGKVSEESSGTRESKRQRMKKLLLRSASMGIGRASNEEKHKDQSESLPPNPKKRFSRKFSFMPTGNSIAHQCNEEKSVSQVTKLTLMQYRPRLFLCMGYGTKYVK
ncbi:hypothetical protein JRO89_XS10G0100400 [Xanthoceras sorbifolium]|uniref:Uncharacterized protein n=1 Tax=Xanthoceras sorbifolium TaxID=99658 RepID=A0ABQ8HI74_9ROSI|nr:hypothetical protein JRO89_XS10G0100400 [Xanthoceras sorbifolium]